MKSYLFIYVLLCTPFELMSARTQYYVKNNIKWYLVWIIIKAKGNMISRLNISKIHLGPSCVPS